MKTMKAAKRTLAMACAVIAATFALTGTAFAATVSGADFSATGSAIESGNVDVLHVDGKAGETVFLGVSLNGRPIARNLLYTIGQDAAPGDEATWAGVATLDISGFDLKSLDGSYTIEAFEDHDGKKPLYAGKLYGVYADLEGGGSKLIGTRTADASELTTRDFLAPAMVYDNGQTYKLVSESNKKGALHFKYEKYDEATTVDGVVNYLDPEGNVVAKSDIPGIGYGKQEKVNIPNVVVADNGDLYRTVFFKDSIVAKNPGATTFSIYCTKITEADKALAGYYVATIKMVDENGAIIASDSVDVTGNFIYTAPEKIYKKEQNTSIGAPAVVTYQIKGSPTIHLSAQSAKEDGVVNRARTITVKYTTQDPEQPSVDVAFNLLDGSKRVGDPTRRLGPAKHATVTLDSKTAVPDSTVEYNGAKYNIVGDPSDYAYTIRSGEVPSINVYYVPEGYTPPGPYEVKVNYVNYLTKETVESHTYTSDPNATEALTIETPESFEANGVEYIRLDGQEGEIEHSYYSNIGEYTIYYRDKNDTLSSGTVINTIRVVYRDGGTTVTPGETTVTAGGAEGGADADATGGVTAGGVDAGAGAAGAAEGAGAAAGDEGAEETPNMQLNDGRTYNVFDGEGNNGAMTNESGVDTNTERIEDNETPLASGFDKGGTSTAASSLSGMAAWMLPVGIGIVAILVVGAAVMFIRRRKLDEADEA